MLTFMYYISIMSKTANTCKHKCMNPANLFTRANFLTIKPLSLAVSTGNSNVSKMCF